MRSNLDVVTCVARCYFQHVWAHMTYATDCPDLVLILNVNVCEVLYV